MSMLNTELYDALISANAPEAEARKAAMSIPGHEQVVTKTDLAEFKADIKAELKVLRWMVGVNMALTMGLLWHAIA